MAGDKALKRYPYGRQSITDEDIAAVNNVLRSPFLTQGPEIPKFERAFERTTGARNAVAVSNGTAALHLAYIAAGLDETHGLLCTPVTFLATAAAARMLNAPVAFTDVDPVTGLMTPETLRAAFEEVPFRVAAVTCVHLGGRMCDLSGLRRVCDDYGALLIEDACHAPGATHVRAGTTPTAAGACELTDFATFSFHPVKHIATGEGGVVCCRDDAIRQRLARLRSHGIDRSPKVFPEDQETGPWTYVNTEIGWNYRLTDLQAALGTSQLTRFEISLARRRELACEYGRVLSGINHLGRPPLPKNEVEHAWHLYAIALDFDALGMRRGDVMEALSAKGVGTQVHYIPLYRQPAYAHCGGISQFPGAEHYYTQTLSIPLYPDLTAADVDYIAQALTDVLGRVYA